MIKKLNESLIASLIPIVGDRAIFIDYWCKHFKNVRYDDKQLLNKKRVNIIFLHEIISHYYYKINFQ